MPEEESISRDRQTNSHYRRKSERQAMRDRQRCQQWRASAQGSRNSETNDHQESSHSVNAATPVVSPDYEGHTMKTRSKGSPIEVARPDLCEMYSFILDPAAEPFVCDTPSVIENKSLLDQDTADDSSMINVPRSSCTVDDEHSFVTEDQCTISIDCDSDSGSTASNVLVTGCSNYDCLYYAGNDFASTNVKCSDNKYQSYICSMCLAEGGHAKHKKFLAPRPSDSTGT